MIFWKIIAWIITFEKFFWILRDSKSDFFHKVFYCERNYIFGSRYKLLSKLSMRPSQVDSSDIPDCFPPNNHCRPDWTSVPKLPPYLDPSYQGQDEVRVIAEGFGKTADVHPKRSVVSFGAPYSDDFETKPSRVQQNRVASQKVTKRITRGLEQARTYTNYPINYNPSSRLVVSGE